MTLRDESWSQDADRLIDAIGRPYRWNFVALRSVFALVAIVVAMKLLMPMLPDERANDVVFVRILVASLAGAYALVESAIAFRHFSKLKSRVPVLTLQRRAGSNSSRVPAGTLRCSARR